MTSNDSRVTTHPAVILSEAKDLLSSYSRFFGRFAPLRMTAAAGLLVTRYLELSPQSRVLKAFVTVLEVQEW
jgi:hypothetical protein